MGCWSSALTNSIGIEAVTAVYCECMCSSLLNVLTVLTHEKLSTDLLPSNTGKTKYFLHTSVFICCLTCWLTVLSNAFCDAGDKIIYQQNAFLYFECFTAEINAGTTRCVFFLWCLETHFLGV